MPGNPWDGLWYANNELVTGLLGTGAYKPTYNWGPHIVGLTHACIKYATIYACRIASTVVQTLQTNGLKPETMQTHVQAIIRHLCKVAHAYQCVLDTY